MFLKEEFRTVAETLWRKHTNLLKTHMSQSTTVADSTTGCWALTAMWMAYLSGVTVEAIIQKIDQVHTSVVQSTEGARIFVLAERNEPYLFQVEGIPMWLTLTRDGKTAGIYDGADVNPNDPKYMRFKLRAGPRNQWTTIAQRMVGDWLVLYEKLLNAATGSVADENVYTDMLSKEDAQVVVKERKYDGFMVVQNPGHVYIVKLGVIPVRIDNTCSESHGVKIIETEDAIDNNATMVYWYRPLKNDEEAALKAATEAFQKILM